MNIRKIFILLVLLVAVVGFTMGQDCAATTTVKIGNHKDVGSKDRILTFYQPKDAQYLKGLYAAIFYHDARKGDDFRPHTYVLRKMTVYYKNKKREKQLPELLEQAASVVSVYFPQRLLKVILLIKL